MLKRTLLILLVFFLAYALGFVWFALTLPSRNKYPDAKTDAIVALTGERFRITDSVTELSRGNAEKLFISGIYGEAPINRVIDQAIERQSGPKGNLRSKIFTEDKATSTLENAIETSLWIKENNVESVRLMTAFYHMPRSELIFKKYMPTLVIVPHPLRVPGEGVNPFKSRRLFLLALKEYNKYVITYAWDKTGLSFEVLSRLTKRESR
jgi:uncharacterized SAM-binding protein YcdF (DUF218 family)